MSKLPTNVATAGKITIFTALVAVGVFSLAFFMNLGAQQLQHVEATSTYSATTSVTVLNTPPNWNGDAREEYQSSTSTPTNAGSVVSWIGTATDPNSQPYFLLICSTNATPTPNAAIDYSHLGTAAPTCAAGSTEWAVSASTTSGTQARAATTTLPSWVNQNSWYAWVCDDDPNSPQCNTAYRQGTTTPLYASPFYVNHRPSFSSFWDNSPTLPGATVTFYSTSSDSDVFGTATDTVKLYVCKTNSFSTSTGCAANQTWATSTFTASDVTATHTIAIPKIDKDYPAYGFLVDNHNFAATSSTQGTNSVLTVANATPYVVPGDITLNNAADLTLDTLAGTSSPISLQFQASDDNSCYNAASTSEITGWQVSVYRTNHSTSTCDTVGNYDPNNCYTSTVATTTWNLTCTASSTTCLNDQDKNEVFNCSFPLWYVAEPTSTSTKWASTTWAAAVSPIDDNHATGTLTQGTFTEELLPLLGIALDTNAIGYSALAPGNETPNLIATTTIRAVGNTGVNEGLSGSDMCNSYTHTTPCAVSATSTIPVNKQVYATSTVSYATASSSGDFLTASSTTFLIRVKKSTSTVAQQAGNTFWGIAVPSTISYAGSYTGENTFIAVQSSSTDW